MPDRFTRHPFMSQQAIEETGSDATVRAMLAFELALADAQEARGIVAAGASEGMREALAGHEFDTDAIAQAIETGGNPGIPFVKAARAALPESLRPHWHRGATSQDVVDSAFMLLIKPRLTRMNTLLGACLDAARTLMQAHRDTPMVGRTLMQQALPITFGVQAAHWAVGLEHGRRRLDTVRRNHLPVQFGGAVGVHSGLGEDGQPLMADIAARLDLNAPVLPWHTTRYPVHEVVTALDGLAGSIGKIAVDVATLSQTEIGEVAEPAGENMGESSAMPHKRNPVRCALIRTACQQIHGHAAVILSTGSHPLQRSLGEWHAEGAPLFDAVCLAEGALEQLQVLLDGLQVHPDAMRRNLELTGGLIMAEPVKQVLTLLVDADQAARITGEAADEARRTGAAFADTLASHPAVSELDNEEALRRATRPEHYLGSAGQQVDAVLTWLDDG